MDNEFYPKYLDRERMLSQLAFQNRKVMIYDEVTDDSMFRAQFELMRIRENDIKLGTKKPIEIYINSYGGSVYDGLSLISLIESMKDEGYEITTINMGYAISMGFIISLVGTYRKAYRYANYMFHDISTYSHGKLETIKQDVVQTENLRNMTTSIILKYTSLTEDYINHVFETKTDKYFNADEALELNICDEVI